jgi:membrane-associated protease RseP (regulator of RpoE activity)
LQGNDVVAGADLAQLRETQGHEIHGLIGMDVLRRHVVRLDFDRGKVFFQRSVGADAGDPVPLAFLGSSILPHLSIGISGSERPVHFRIDTGMLAGGAIRKELAAELARRQGAMQWYEIQATALSGASTRPVWRVEEVRLQNWRHKNQFLREGNANSLGLDYLSRYNITIDFPNGMAYFKKSSRHDHDTKLNVTGIRLSRKDGRTWVHAVAGTSPAEQAGIRAGDEVLSIGNQTATRARLKNLDDLLAGEESSIALVISRNGEQFRIALPSRSQRAAPRQ